MLLLRASNYSNGCQKENRRKKIISRLKSFVLVHEFLCCRTDDNKASERERAVKEVEIKLKGNEKKFPDSILWVCVWPIFASMIPISFAKERKRIEQFTRPEIYDPFLWLDENWVEILTCSTRWNILRHFLNGHERRRVREKRFIFNRIGKWQRQKREISHAHKSP